MAVLLRSWSCLSGSFACLLAVAGCGSASRRDAGVDAGADASGDSGSDALGDRGSVVACGPTDASVDRPRRFLDMRITGAGFDAHQGSTVSLYTSRGVLDEVYGVGTQTVSSGAFVFDFPSAYQRNYMQSISWFIDSDGDGVCNAAAGEHVGHVTVGPFDPAGDDRIDVTIADNHTPAFPSSSDACSGIAAPLHDFDVVGAGFDAHEGLTVHVLTDSPYNHHVWGVGQATIVGGGFALHFPRGFERTTYQEIFWFIDVDGDGRCATPNDHTGYAATSAFTPLDASAVVQMAITDNHTNVNAGREDVCVIMNGCRTPL